LPDSLEESLVTNFIPGSDPADPASFVFIDRSDPNQMNAQCQYCHYEVHEMTSEAKASMLAAAQIRCIDCHMAGYAVTESGMVERFHNMQVAANGPKSCSGAYGTDGSCHANATTDWMKLSIVKIREQGH
jgi:hypothetical protein